MKEYFKKELEKTSLDHVLLLIQTVLILFVLVYTVVGFIEPDFHIVTKELLVLSFVSLAINNYKIFKRKYMTFIYVLASILMIGTLFI